MLQFFKSKAVNRSDDELVKAYQATSDMAVLGELYNRYMALVYGLSLKYLQDEGKAEDNVMTIFEQLTIKLKKYEVNNFKSWLHVLTKNHCLMVLRKEKKSALTIFYDNELMQSTDGMHPIDEPDHKAISQENALKECITHLPTGQQECIQLFYFKEKSYKEIVGITGYELHKVRSFIQNGRRNLKICIEKKTTSNE